MIEGLPGTDLGDVIQTLSDSSLDAIAAEVVRAQEITSNTASAGRYGYAVHLTDASRERWSQVLQDNLARSRRRMAAAGLFDLAAVDAMAALVAGAGPELEALPPVPFLDLLADYGSAWACEERTPEPHNSSN